MIGGPRPDRSVGPVLPLVIGVGTEHRGDDRCGLDVARALRERLSGDAWVAECAGDITDLLDLWSGVAEVIVVDALRSGRPPGTVVRLDVGANDLALSSTTSTHGLSLSEAIGLGRSLGRFPGHLVIYGIEAQNVEMGDALSPLVGSAVQETIARVASELQGRGTERWRV